MKPRPTTSVQCWLLDERRAPLALVRVTGGPFGMLQLRLAMERYPDARYVATPPEILDIACPAVPVKPSARRRYATHHRRRPRRVAYRCWC